MPRSRAWLAVLLASAAAALFGCSPSVQEELHGSSRPGRSTTAAEDKQEYPVPPPPFSEGVYPCSECHADLELNLKRRKLTDAHEKIVLQHGPRERWCFDCHNPDDRNKLRLASGTLVTFEQSYRLCGQCHGPKLRDWRVGVHGKRTGQWNGKRRYLLCAHCHDPHSPRFKPLRPMPPPRRPEEIR